jgi:hypothetical protein
VGVLVALALALVAAPAQATTGHAHTGSVGVANDTGPGGISAGGPAGVAVDPSNGDVVISDPGHVDAGGNPAPRIERFDAAGVFQGEFAIDPALYFAPSTVAIDPTDGSIYVAALDASNGAGVILKYSSSGAFAYALNPTASNTNLGSQFGVDPIDGTVYVSASDPAIGLPFVDAFDKTGAYLSKFDGSASAPGGAGFQAIAGIAVDAGHRVYVGDVANRRLDRYSATGTWQATVDDGSRGTPTAVAVDPTSGEIYALKSNGSVSWFTAGGAAHVDTFGFGAIAGGAGVAVDHATSAVYVADNAVSQVLRFTPFAGPTPTTTAASAITTGGATLNGTVDPEGGATTYHFDYGPDTSYGTSTADAPAGSGTAPVPVSGPATGLLPHAEYHFRVVATNAGGSVYGEDMTFTTAPVPPVLDGAGGAAPPFASEITADGGRLTGTIDPMGSDTTFHFEYGKTTAYGAASPDQTTGAGRGDGQFATDAPIAGLDPGTTYHFRLVADNGAGGAQTGVDRTFTTAPGTPADAASVTGATALLTGVIDPHGSDTTYHFDYGPDAFYGQSTPEASAGSGTGEQTVSAAIAGLTPDTTYHVRVVATDVATGITTTGRDGTFATDPPPSATTGAVTGVGTTQATFGGIADTHGRGGSYHFEVESSTISYRAQTGARTIASGEPAATVTGALTDLSPGETYTVRLSVTSGGMTTLGDTVTFTTAPRPPVAPPAPRAPAPAPAQAADVPRACTAPVLAAYDRHPKPGQTITITGKDLGARGTVALGRATVAPKRWSATGFSITLPRDATGTLPLTVNCGTASNTIAIQIYKAPSNAFTAKGRVKGASATLSVKVPGPGAIVVSGGSSIKKATRHAGRAATTSVTVALSAEGRRSLRRHGTLAITLKVRFTPTGGKQAARTFRVVFRR